MSTDAIAVERGDREEESMREQRNAVAGPGALSIKAWFGTIARKFPPDEIHLFTSEMKYLFGSKPKRRRQEGEDRFPTGKSIFEVVDEKIAGLIAKEIERVLNGETVSFEVEYKGRRYLSHAVSLYNPNDSETYVLVHATDVTELKDLEYKPAGRRVADPLRPATVLKEPAQNWRALYEVIPFPIFLIEGDGKIVFANRGFRNLLGYGEAEISTLGLQEVAAGLDLDAWKKKLSERGPSGSFVSNVDLRHVSGILVGGEIEFAPTGPDPQDLICACVSAIGQEYGVYGDLGRSDEMFRLISENVPDLITVIDFSRRHVYLNPSYKSIVSNPETLLGNEALDLVHPDDREKVKVVLREGLSSGVEQRIEFRMLSSDGSIRFVEARGKATLDSAGDMKNAVIVGRDVTERRKLEDQYFRNQRIESLGTLAGGISHDLNNVLTPVILGVEALKRVQMEERGRAILNSIGSSLGRGRDIVKQVLTFARGVEGGMMLIQTRHIIKEAGSLIKETFPKSIAIVENVPKSLWLVNGDATRIDQLVMNLVVNARDAMPDGGILYVSAEDTMIDEQYAAMQPAAKPGPYVRITVQDTGVGMAKGVRDHIFEPFFTTKESGKGTGLGLSIVHTIVKNHSGFVSVESEPGKGTTFNVFLPAIETQDLERPEETDTKLLAGHGELLLVVDDEVSVCQITKQTLEAFGYRALTASDGTEAVALFAEKKNEVSLVLMDIAMPIMDGPRTMRAIRKLKPGVKIIASSGIVPEGQLNIEDIAAPNEYLSKPYTSDRLLRTIRSVLEAL